MNTSETRQSRIESHAGEGNLDDLKKLFSQGFSQVEIDVALENAIAYSQIKTSEYLLSLGANFANYNYQGVYYAVTNNELEGLNFAITNGVDINVNNGMILNVSIISCLNSKSTELVEWILNNGADTSLLTPDSHNLVEKYGSKALRNLIKNADSRF